jgi:hypothetical protein
MCFIQRYREYEALIDQALADFAGSEGITEEELGGVLQATVGGREGGQATVSASRSLGMLVAAGNYPKFVAMMSARAKEATP